MELHNFLTRTFPIEDGGQDITNDLIKINLGTEDDPRSSCFLLHKVHSTERTLISSIILTFNTLTFQPSQKVNLGLVIYCHLVTLSKLTARSHTKGSMSFVFKTLISSRLTLIISRNKTSMPMFRLLESNTTTSQAFVE